MHARFDFSWEGCANDEGIKSHNDLTRSLSKNFVLERDLSGERVLLNTPCELAEHMERHFESLLAYNSI
jgi:hypothetical protein